MGERGGGGAKEGTESPSVRASRFIKAAAKKQVCEDDFESEKEGVFYDQFQLH